MGSIARMGPNHPKVVDTCPSHQPQPIGRNRVFEIERPEPPLKNFNVTLIGRRPFGMSKDPFSCGLRHFAILQ